MKQKTNTSKNSKKALYPLTAALLILLGSLITVAIVSSVLVTLFFGKDDTAKQDKNFQIVAGDLKELKQEISKDSIFGNVSDVTDKCTNDGEAFSTYRCEVLLSADSHSTDQDITAHLRNLLISSSSFVITSQINSGNYNKITEISSKHTGTPCSVTVDAYSSSQQLYISCGFSSRSQIHIK